MPSITPPTAPCGSPRSSRSRGCRSPRTVRGGWSRHKPLTKQERLLRLKKTTCECQIELNTEQIGLLERLSPEFRERHIHSRHTGDLVAVDTFFVGHLKGVGKVYLQTAIHCHSRYAWGRLHPNKLPVTAVHIMNNEVPPPSTPTRHGSPPC